MDDVQVMKKVSIIIPVYNCEDTLNECLEAILNQTYTNFEAICIDDGSKDNSWKILEEYSKKDLRIKAYKQENLGCAISRYNAIKKASGDYIMFCDGDDYYEKDMVECMTDAMEKTNADMVVCDCKIISIDNFKITPAIKDFHKLRFEGLYNVTNKTLSNLNPFVWNKIYKKELIDKYNLAYLEKYTHEDVIFNYKYLCYSKTFYGLKKVLYNYRIGNKNSITGHMRAHTKKDYLFDFIYSNQQFLDFIEENKKTIFAGGGGEHISYMFDEIYSRIRYGYRMLGPEYYFEAYEKIQEFIGKNPVLTKNKLFFKLYRCPNFVTFNKSILKRETYSLLQNLFSIKNSYDKSHKILSLSGFRIKFKNPKYSNINK